ncbi:hypothetical protein [Massilia glaciei]|uniref:Gylcosyl hydrolase 115 C-terminal domain-containing protein n=1 Tax=Massilia glaciei TaxID=1524097 RepID=A0A2U2I6N5_9BURK|nr:hypothetical protein [Massilia glaciei]PWF55423.1 hypothetical protein C7C56_001965 [Massilia glaciei]
MMDAAPRRLPVFGAPLFPTYDDSPSRRDCALAYPTPLSPRSGTLAFTSGRAETKTITIINYAARALAWSAASVSAGFKLSALAGELNDENGFEQRVKVSYDGSKIGEALSFQCGTAKLQPKVAFSRGAANDVATEHEQIITMPATQAVAAKGWALVPGLGSYGASMRAKLSLESIDASVAPSGPALDFAFASHSKEAAQLKLVALPVHVLTSKNQLRIAISLDGGPVEVIDFATHGRSEEWKANTLTNTAVRTRALASLKPGPHRLRVHALDPGFVLDRIEISFEGAAKYYGKPPSANQD